MNSEIVWRLMPKCPHVETFNYWVQTQSVMFLERIKPFFIEEPTPTTITKELLSQTILESNPSAQIDLLWMWIRRLFTATRLSIVDFASASSSLSKSELVNILQSLPQSMFDDWNSRVSHNDVYADGAIMQYRIECSHITFGRPGMYDAKTEEWLAPYPSVSQDNKQAMYGIPQYLVLRLVMSAKDTGRIVKTLERNICLGIIPCMVGSCLCLLPRMTSEEYEVCDESTIAIPRGVFIWKNKMRVLSFRRRLSHECIVRPVWWSSTRINLGMDVVLVYHQAASSSTRTDIKYPGIFLVEQFCLDTDPYYERPKRTPLSHLLMTKLGGRKTVDMFASEFSPPLMHPSAWFVPSDTTDQSDEPFLDTLTIEGKQELLLDACRCLLDCPHKLALPSTLSDTVVYDAAGVQFRIIWEQVFESHVLPQLKALLPFCILEPNETESEKLKLSNSITMPLLQQLAKLNHFVDTTNTLASLADTYRVESAQANSMWSASMQTFQFLKHQLHITNGMADSVFFSVVDAPELDPIDTPDGLRANSINRLCLGIALHETTGRPIVLEDCYDGYGIVSRHIPFVQHAQPFRSMLACTLLRQARPFSQSQTTPFSPWLPASTHRMASMPFWALTTDDSIPYSRQVADNPRSILLDGTRMEDGQKMSTLHGCKGTVACLIPLGKLPYTQDRTRIDGILDPLWGVPGRVLPNMFLESSSLRNDTHVVFDPRTGQRLHHTIPILVLNMLSLRHVASKKLGVRNDGKRNVKTHQPIGGIQCQTDPGGIQIGVMERDCLDMLGACSVRQSLCLEQSGSETATFVWCPNCHQQSFEEKCRHCGCVTHNNEKWTWPQASQVLHDLLRTWGLGIKIQTLQ